MANRQELNEEKLRNVGGGIRFDFEKARELAKLLKPESEKKEQDENSKK